MWRASGRVQSSVRILPDRWLETLGTDVHHVAGRARLAPGTFDLRDYSLAYADAMRKMRDSPQSGSLESDHKKAIEFFRQFGDLTILPGFPTCGGSIIRSTFTTGRSITFRRFTACYSGENRIV